MPKDLTTDSAVPASFFFSLSIALSLSLSLSISVSISLSVSISVSLSLSMSISLSAFFAFSENLLVCEKAFGFSSALSADAAVCSAFSSVFPDSSDFLGLPPFLPHSLL